MKYNEKFNGNKYIKLSKENVKFLEQITNDVEYKIEIPSTYINFWQNKTNSEHSEVEWYNVTIFHR